MYVYMQHAACRPYMHTSAIADDDAKCSGNTDYHHSENAGSAAT